MSRRPLAAWLTAAASALLLFGVLAAEIASGHVLPFDLRLRAAIHSLATPPLTRAMRAVTWLGSSAFLFAAAALLVWRLVREGRRRAGILLAAATTGGVVLDEALKLVFHRARPETFFGYTPPDTYSFPSGHALASCCFFGMAAAIYARPPASRGARAAVWAAASLATLAVGLSRVYLGVHYPSDVLAGYAAAVVWIALVRGVTAGSSARSRKPDRPAARG